MSVMLGYARVSTGGQDLEGQRIRLRQAGAERIFEDVISGATFERAGLGGLLDYARAGDTVAVVRLDRLGRSVPEILKTTEQLRERRIALVSLEESIDTNTAAGELVFHVFASLAQFERRLISERTKAGQAAARRRGRVPGRRAIGDDKIEAAITLVEKGGLSPRAAAAQVGIGKSTVYREIRARMPVEEGGGGMVGAE